MTSNSFSKLFRKMRFHFNVNLKYHLLHSCMFVCLPYSINKILFTKNKFTVYVVSLSFDLLIRGARCMLCDASTSLTINGPPTQAAKDAVHVINSSPMHFYKFRWNVSKLSISLLLCVIYIYLYTRKGMLHKYNIKQADAQWLYQLLCQHLD